MLKLNSTAASILISAPIKTSSSPRPDLPVDVPAIGALAQGENLDLQESERGPLRPTPLRFEASLVAEAAKKPQKPKQISSKLPPAPTPPEPEPVAIDPDAGIDKPPLLLGSQRAPEKADEQIYSEYLSLQREIRDDLAKNQTPFNSSEQRGLIQDKLLLRLGREKYLDLPTATKNALNQFLNHFELKDLVVTEVQAEGGAEAVDGIVTGTGVDGHYTNSMLRSIQALLENERLTPDLLLAMENLMAAPLHPELSNQRQTLMRSGLQELAFPERIEQHAKGTCAPTTVQILLALKNPVQYLSILQALASPDGKVPGSLLHGASGMEREADTLQNDRSGRSLSSRLLQPAFMEYANGDENYDNRSDRNSDGKKEYSGLDEKGAVRLNEALFGAGSYVFRFVNAQPDPAWQGFVKADTLMHELTTALAQGEPVPVGLRWGESAHKVLLTEIDSKEDKAFFMNPWGELQVMPLEVFQARIDSASLPKLSNISNQNRSALAGLPGEAQKKTAYNAISNWRYYKVTDYLLEDPVLKKLPDERKTLLREKFRSLRLSPEYASRQLDLLAHLTKTGLADQNLFARIQEVRDKDDLAALVRLYSLSEKLPIERLKPLLAVAPDQNLDSAYYQLLMTHLDNPALTEALLAKAQTNKIAKETGTLSEQAGIQAKIKEDFITIESGGSLEQLKNLSQNANEQTRLFILLKISEKWPVSQAEQAAQIMTADLDLLSLKYVLQGLEPNTDFGGADTPEQIRRFVRSHVRTAAIQHQLAAARQ
jgi:hypothetical protein